MGHLLTAEPQRICERWHWAGAQNQHAAPLRSPNADTASQAGYNIANDKTPQRRTFLTPTSEGDQRHLYGQGKPQAKDSSGAGAHWYLGEQSESTQSALQVVNSRTMFDGTVTATDMDRATDAREKGRIGIVGSAQAYSGSSGRVTSERIGRDINPLGRGDGNAYVGGAMNLGRLFPRLPKSYTRNGTGNSVNNTVLPPGSGGEDGVGGGNPTPPSGGLSSIDCSCSYCIPMVEITENESWGFTGDCATPDCFNELCNNGCEVGWTSGSVMVCCKDKDKICTGPISAPGPEDVGQVGLIANTQSTTNTSSCTVCGGSHGYEGDEPRKPNGDWKDEVLYDEALCLQHSMCWDCCKYKDISNCNETGSAFFDGLSNLPDAALRGCLQTLSEKSRNCVLTAIGQFGGKSFSDMFVCCSDEMTNAAVSESGRLKKAWAQGDFGPSQLGDAELACKACENPMQGSTAGGTLPNQDTGKDEYYPARIMPICYGNYFKNDIALPGGPRQALAKTILHEIIHRGGCIDHDEVPLREGGSFVGVTQAAICILGLVDAGGGGPAL